MKRPASPPSQFHKVGVIAAAHGVRGQVKIRSFLESPDALLLCAPLHDHSGRRHFRLTRHGIQKDVLIAAIDGVTDRNQAELLKGTELYTVSSKAQDHSNAWPYAELTGLEARLENGRVYGRVSGVFNFGAGDIVEIATASGGSEMLPFRHAYIGEVNVRAGYLVVMPPDYIESDGESDDGDATSGEP